MHYPIELNVLYQEKQSRLSSFFRIILAIPQCIVLYFLSIAAGVIIFLSWWVILFTGRYPKSFYDFITWYLRWNIRVGAYIYLLTDKYPPFSGEKFPLVPPSAEVKPQ
jgi:hypothetical protein